MLLVVTQCLSCGAHAPLYGLAPTAGQPLALLMIVIFPALPSWVMSLETGMRGSVMPDDGQGLIE